MNYPRFDYKAFEYVPELPDTFRLEVRRQYMRLGNKDGPRPPPVYQNCRCCGEYTDDAYMLHDWLWSVLGLHHMAGRACLPCVDTRVQVRAGRQLELTDFTNSPINHPIRWAWAKGKAA